MVVPDGAEVIIVIPSHSAPNGEVMSASEEARYRDALARIDAIADENPGDAFSGADHDQALYGDRQ